MTLRSSTSPGDQSIKLSILNHLGQAARVNEGGSEFKNRHHRSNRGSVSRKWLTPSSRVAFTTR